MWNSGGHCFWPWKPDLFWPKVTFLFLNVPRGGGVHRFRNYSQKIPFFWVFFSASLIMPVSFSRFYKERLLGTCIADQLWKESKMKRKRWKCNKDIEFSAVPFYLAKTKKSFKVTLISAEMGYSGFLGKILWVALLEISAAETQHGGELIAWKCYWMILRCSA